MKNGRFRVIILYGMLLTAFCVCSLRICTTGSSMKASSGAVSSKRIDIAESRGIIYDRNMKRLTCDEFQTVLAVKPTVRALNSLKQVLDSSDFDNALSEIERQNPIVIDADYPVYCEDIMNAKIYKRYNNTLALHLVGYLSDSGDGGISGLEKAYDDVLALYNGNLSARFNVKADGKALPGGEIIPIDDNYNSNGGIVLTIDKEYQIALEAAMDKCRLKKGAAVMVEVETGQVVACASRPLFDRENIGQALDDEDLPLFNRAFGEYPVGSVFKPLIALCALEQGLDGADKYECKGYTVVGDNVFRCMKSHGSVDMAGALAYSCNCYFIDLFERMDKAEVIQAAQNLGFGYTVQLSERISACSGNLPEVSDLESAGAAANFSFGQGELSANIFQVSSLYCAIASGGKLRYPYLVKGLCDNDMKIYKEYNSTPPSFLFSDKSSQTVKSCLELAVREGTGTKAEVDNIRVCGKTASAQSGDFSSGDERIVTWFAGFYPYENPEYVLVVVCEDGESGSSDCAPIFSETVRALTKDSGQ